jgi:hypothetical protein
VKVVEDKLNTEMKDLLSAEFSNEEVYQAIKDMKCLAAPGPDGLPLYFFTPTGISLGKMYLRKFLTF